MTTALREALRRALASAKKVSGPAGPLPPGDEDLETALAEEPLEIPPQEREERPTAQETE